MKRGLFALVGATAALTLPAASFAAESHSPHRISLGTRLGAAAFGADDDGHWTDHGLVVGFGAGYAYDLGNVEFGGGVDLFIPEADGWHVRGPWVSVRPHFAVSSVTDLGLTLRAGYAWQTIADVPDDTGGAKHDHTFGGPLYAVDVGVRFWTSPAVAWEFGPELVVASGADGSDVRGYYLRKEAGLTLIGGFFRGVFAP